MRQAIHCLCSSALLHPWGSLRSSAKRLHRALQQRHGERFHITYGTHSTDDDGTLLPTFVEGQPYDRALRSRVWKIEEKKTDVNIALGVYRDVAKGLVDRVILVSNDSDTEPLLEAVREDFPHVMIGVVMPRHPVKSVDAPQRRRSGSLAAGVPLF